MGRRVIIIVLDSLGVGELEDACLYGDQGSNTLKNLAAAAGGVKLPNLEAMGLGNIVPVEGVRPVEHSTASFGKAREKSRGKDTTTGHWEIMGLVLDRAFPTYPHGFPVDLIKEFENRIGRKTLGNKPASGTVIIEELGAEHIRTGFPIVYTSADSVFQIAAHEKVIPLDELYAMCRTARELLKGEHGVGRVIARPFVGESGKFTRTSNRHDFSLAPDRTILDFIHEAGLEVIGIGKINDIYAGRGVNRSLPTVNNHDGVDKILEVLKEDFSGLVFANLVDFDQQYGHRNDPHGYAGALEEFDRRLPEIINHMNKEDMLILTADHGCDPTTPGTDHTREYVPILIYGYSIKPGVNLGVRDSFADTGQTTADYLDVKIQGLAGTSYLEQVRCNR